HIDLDPATVATWSPAAPALCQSAGARCVQVNAYRDGTNGSNALPVYFGILLGQSSQATKASATAIVASGNATNCMRPFAVVDKWQELHTPLDSSQFNRWISSGSNAVEAPPVDLYVPPTSNNVGTGFSVPTDVGA